MFITGDLTARYKYNDVPRGDITVQNYNILPPGGEKAKYS
jgi:hypothetical protein